MAEMSRLPLWGRLTWMGTGWLLKELSHRQTGNEYKLVQVRTWENGINHQGAEIADETCRLGVRRAPDQSRSEMWRWEQRTESGMPNVNRAGIPNTILPGPGHEIRGEPRQRVHGWDRCCRRMRKILIWGWIEKGRKRAYSKEVLTHVEETRQPAGTSDGKLPRQHRALFQMQPWEATASTVTKPARSQIRLL